ncbi:MAG: ABC transporter permease, partial [Acidobacteriota bacterium]|nr:ABC transporter permease [Acidobacteriota bacterium]
MGADVAPGPGFEVPRGAVGAVVSDEFRSHFAVLGQDGHVRVFDADGRQVVDRPAVLSRTGEEPETAEPLVGTVGAPGQPLLVGATGDGRVVSVPVDWKVSFDGPTRVVTPVVGDPILFELDPDGTPVSLFAGAIEEDGAATAAAQLSDGSLVVVKREVEENLLTQETTESWRRSETIPPKPQSAMVLDAAGRNLYGGTADGELLWWSLAGRDLPDPQILSPGAAGVTALSLLIGDRSLVAIEIWFPVRRPPGEFELTRIRSFEALDGPIREISPSLRDKGFLALDDNATMGLFYSTSHRVLWTGPSLLTDPVGLYFTPKADGAILSGDGRIASLDIDNPHPEVSLTALFGRVWYEGREEPEYVWQSTGGTDEFESKLSLTPLMVGTLKGTVYSLLLAIPLGVLGAMYTSQFMHPGLKRYVKPTVEIMAALPSVVLGFLAGLWLAPRVTQYLPAMALMLFVLPLVVLGAG